MQFSTRGLNIMVADADRTVLEMLQIRLGVAGYHASVVRTGQTALEAISHARPAGLVLELNLPDMSGHEVLEALKAANDGTSIPVLVIGRKFAPEDIRRAVSLGARDCMTKPFSGAELLERLTRMLKPKPSAPDRKVVLV